MTNILTRLRSKRTLNMFFMTFFVKLPIVYTPARGCFNNIQIVKSDLKYGNFATLVCFSRFLIYNIFVANKSNNYEEVFNYDFIYYVITSYPI